MLNIINANQIGDPPNAVMLDRAITAVGSRELRRLSEDLSNRQVADKIEAALKALKGLRRGIKPTYDEWISLWYLLWFQGSQASVAAGMMRNLVDYRINYGVRRADRRNLCIIDVGSGAFIGALGLSDIINAYGFKFTDFNAINFVAIDPSEEMKNLGTQLWDELRTIRDHQPPRPAATGTRWEFRGFVSETVDIEQIRSLNPGKTEYWLSAFNSLHPGQRDQVKDQLSLLHQTLDPTVGFFTTSGKANPRLRDSIPLPGSKYHLREINQDDMTATELRGNLPKLTSLRRRTHRLHAQHFRDRNFVAGYLNNPVKWTPENSRGIICVRKNERDGL